jgi:Spy/CpxP family protein refolding chaperone
MKTSLKVLLTLVSFALGAAVPLARAADPAPADQARSNKEHAAKPEKGFARLQEQLQPLNLTQDQKAKVDAIVQDSKKAAGEIQADVHAKAKELRQSTLAKIREVLTPEQAAQLGRHAKGKGHGKAKPKVTPESAVTP